MRHRKKTLHKRLNLPIKWSLFGLIIGIVLATVGSIGAFNGWFGGGGNIPSDTITRGLVGYWPFDEGMATTSYDSSGYGNHGVLTSGPSWGGSTTTCKVAGCLTFDGTNDFVSLPTSDSLDIRGTNSLTITAWVKTGVAQGTNMGIMRRAEQSGFSHQRFYGLEFSNTFRGVISNNTSQVADTINASGTYVDDKWHFGVFVYDRSFLYIYVDGESKANPVKLTTSGIDPTSTANNRIGSGSSHGGFFNGLIDEVRVYNRALSAEEIRYHYNRGAPVAHWKFDEGTASTTYDSTDNNNDGTISLGGSGNTTVSSAWVAGKYGSALSFDGTDDFVDAGNVSANARTISFWLKRGDTSDKDVIDLGTPEIKISSNAITSTGLTLPTYYINAIPNTTAVGTVNQWYYVTITDTADINASNIDIAKASTNYFSGLIDDVRIYNYARTPEEIRLDYNAGFAAHFGPKSDCKRDPGSCMTQGLVVYLPFDESSGTATYDISGNSNHGIFSTAASERPKWGSSTTTCKVAGCLNFDGTNDVITIEESDSHIWGTSDVGTIEMWVNPQAYKTADGFSDIMGDEGGTQDLKFEFSNASGQITFYAWSTFINSGSNTVPTVQWTHIVGTWGDFGVKLYFNGVEVGSTKTTVSAATSNQDIYIGSRRTGFFYSGLIDEVKFYRRSLSPEEIRYHYNRGAPVGHWKFDEGTASTTYDSTDNNNDGTLSLGGSGNTTVSSAWVTGKYGGALSFDGADDYVNAGGNTFFDFVSPPYSFAMWVKLNNNVGPTFLGKNCGASSPRWTFTTGSSGNSGKLRFYSTNMSVLESYSNSVIPTGAWKHIAAVLDGSTITFYIDGVRDGQSALTGTNTTCNNPMTIGAYLDGTTPTNPVNGLIDDVRIYNYARTPEEIRLDYNAGFAAHFGPKSDCKRDPGSCMTQGLVGYWPFDEGMATTSYDSSGNNNHGVLTGGTRWGGSTTTCKVAGCLSFDGTNDYADAGNISSDGSIQTVEFWIKDSNATDGILELVNNANYVSISSSAISTTGFTSPTTYINGAVATALASGWNHVVVTTGTAISPTSFLVGEANSDFMEGLLDEVRIYNRALSAEEIRYHYNRGGPVAHWKFDEGTASTTYDSTDNNNDGTLSLGGSGNVTTSLAWVAGKHGSALSFDGVDDYVSVPDVNILDITNAITLSAWVKAETLTSSGDGVVYKPNVWGFDIKSDGAIRSAFYTSVNGTLTAYDSNAGEVATGAWYYVGVTYDGASVRLYKNGIEVKNFALTGTIQTSLNALKIGEETNSTYNFNGLIDDVRIYNYARSPEQILTDYNQGLSTHFR